MASELLSIRGYVQHTIWAGDSYRVVRFLPEVGNEFVAAGPIQGVDSDDLVELVGSWVDNAKYGTQFKITSSFKVVPTNLAGKTNYLLKHIDGLGPSRAKKLVDYFGHEVTKVLEGDPEVVAKCPGISFALAEKICKSWKKENDSFKRQVGMFLAQNNISDNWTDKVIACFKDKAITIIQANPYKLTKIDGVGFKTADRLAKSLGWPALSKERTEAAFSHVLQEATSEGHVFLFHGEIIERVKKVASKDEDGKRKTFSDQEIETALEAVIGRKELVKETIKISGTQQIIYYLESLHDCELKVSEKLAQMLTLPDQYAVDRIKPVVRSIEENEHYELSEDQFNAVAQGLTKSVSVITGLPGSGKTSCQKALIKTALKLGRSVVLCAPTGRAAKRMAEVTEQEATTIHRLLEYNGDTGGFSRDSQNPIDGDLLIVDEFSMCDLELTAALLEAIPPTMSVVFVGDANQLPSIGPGSVLKDLINSKVVHTSNLTKIFRQAEGSLIIQNAHRICRGETMVFPEKGQEADCYFIEVPKDNGKDNIDWIKKSLPSIMTRLGDRFKVDPTEDIQVLIPMKKGPCGYTEFNITLQEFSNPSGEQFTAGLQDFRVGDRVMQIKNNYTEGIELYNGDIGTIVDYDSYARTVFINFYGRVVEYPYGEVNNLLLAQASSIHRSQGSEFPVVVIILTNHHYSMLDRNLLYTAHTRGKKASVYVASKTSIDIAINNNEAHKRNSLLSHRIRAKYKQIS